MNDSLYVSPVGQEQYDDLTNNATQQFEEVMRRQAFETAVVEAFRTTVERPGADYGFDPTADLADPYVGDVGEARMRIDPQAAELKAQAEGDNGAQERLIDRVNTLYLDMTNYQVAWSVARKLQQDVSQLLRG